MNNFYVQVKNINTEDVTIEYGPFSKKEAIDCADDLDNYLAEDVYVEVIGK